ncbi:hypothetical protein DFH94DRAFT_281302 [Russula ochroleuca]|jgi:hypothetical protein|uniref:Uncharacterized protein n=1 Tax=Russula ochroleuca TaxID=152965 RepID=A0A9P5MNV3_9AGAM|nr:hypothetical protein DFH94DRAFT_281302 [Russula ochroleuca]
MTVIGCCRTVPRSCRQRYCSLVSFTVCRIYSNLISSPVPSERLCHPMVRHPSRQCSEKTRVRDGQRKRGQRLVRTEATGVDADAQRQTRTWSPSRMSATILGRYRERHRERRVNTSRSGGLCDRRNAVQERLEQDEAKTSRYLSHHQEQTIHDFLDRLVPIHDDIHERTTCFERYHCIQMRGSQCARCHKEIGNRWALSLSETGYV